MRNIMLTCWLALMMTVSAPGQQQKNIVELCKAIIEQRAKGVPLVKTKEFLRILHDKRNALPQLLQMSRSAQIPIPYRLLVLDIMIYLGDSNSVRPLLPMVINPKESIVLRKKILQVASAFKVPEFFHYIVIMLERKLNAGIRLGLYCSHLDLAKQAVVVARLFALFQSKDPQIRQQAITMFQYIQYPDSIARLKPLLKDTAPGIRKLALEAICHQQNYRSPQLMLAMLNDPAPIVRDRALFLLRRYCQQSHDRRSAELFTTLWSKYQKERAIFEKIYREYRQNSIVEKRLAEDYRQKPERCLQIDRALKRARIACDNLYQQMDRQQALLRTWLVTLATVAENPAPIIGEILFLLGHEDLVIAQIAFSCLEIQGIQQSYRFPSGLDQKIITGVIEYFSRLQQKKWLWRSVSRFLERLTGAKPAPTPDAWRQWRK